MAKKKSRRTVKLDAELIDRQRTRLGLSTDEVAHRAKLSPGTMSNALNGNGVFIDKVRRLAEVLEIDDPYDLVVRDESDGSGTTINEWNYVVDISRPRTASNGLGFQICKLRHTFLDTLARGKAYDLKKLATKQVEEMKNQLLRHPMVCQELEGHPNIAQNITTFPEKSGDRWWVIDKWIDGEPLDRVLEKGPLALNVAAAVARGMAEGLRALHEKQVVRRELAPEFIYLCDKKRPVLTDFELAKLLTGAPTVSHGETKNEYSAPEVGAGTIDARADLYSWARIVLHCVIGEAPKEGTERNVIQEIELPKAVVDIVLACLEPVGNRPKSADEIIRAIRKWK